MSLFNLYYFLIKKIFFQMYYKRTLNKYAASGDKAAAHQPPLVKNKIGNSLLKYFRFFYRQR